MKSLKTAGLSDDPETPCRLRTPTYISSPLMSQRNYIRISRHTYISFATFIYLFSFVAFLCDPPPSYIQLFQNYFLFYQQTDETVQQTNSGIVAVRHMNKIAVDKA